MGKLKQINEALEGLKVEKVITDLTNNTDTETIAEFVNSKKKDERIAIAANPRLTKEQQTKLANDKVASVKEALCFNAKLDLELAKQLLEEEPERIELIIRYVEGSDDLLLDNLPDEITYKERNKLDRLLENPGIKESTITKLIAMKFDSLTGPSGRPLQRNKNLSDKSIQELFDYYLSVKTYNDGSASRLMNNNPKYFTLQKIKSIPNWEKEPEIQATVLFRDDMPADMIIKVIENLDADKDTSADMGYSKNPVLHSAPVLNAYMKLLISVTDPTSYKYEWNIFEKALREPLDPELMVKLVNKVQQSREPNHHGLKHIIKNINFPEDAMDRIVIDRNSLTAVVANKNISQSRVEALILKYLNNKDALEQLMWGLAANKTVKISDDIQLKMLQSEIQKIYNLKIMVRGSFADKILDNLDEYTWTIKSDWVEPQYEKSALLKALIDNENLTANQRRKILSLWDNLGADEKRSYDSRETLENMFITRTNNNDEDFVEELVKKNPKAIWSIWTEQGSAYFQYGDFQPTIDKIALSDRSGEVPVAVLTGISSKNFTDWFNYNNNAGHNFPDSKGMTKETAKKYLLKFIEKGEDKLIAKLSEDNFIGNDWLDDDILSAMYDRTEDEKFMSDELKDLFVF